MNILWIFLEFAECSRSRHASKEISAYRCTMQGRGSPKWFELIPFSNGISIGRSLRRRCERVLPRVRNCNNALAAGAYRFTPIDLIYRQLRNGRRRAFTPKRRESLHLQPGSCIREEDVGRERYTGDIFAFDPRREISRRAIVYSGLAPRIIANATDAAPVRADNDN